jgi:hypothetical protein
MESKKINIYVRSIHFKVITDMSMHCNVKKKPSNFHRNWLIPQMKQKQNMFSLFPRFLPVHWSTLVGWERDGRKKRGISLSPSYTLQTCTYHRIALRRTNSVPLSPSCHIKDSRTCLYIFTCHFQAISSNLYCKLCSARQRNSYSFSHRISNMNCCLASICLW